MEALPNAFLLNGRAKKEGKGLLELLRNYFSKRRIYAIRSELLFIFKGNVLQNTGGNQQSSISIREFYELSEYKAEALWMLIYLDREYVYNKRLQYDTIRQSFEEGNNSSLLYFEACDILNEEPELYGRTREV